MGGHAHFKKVILQPGVVDYGVEHSRALSPQ